jgi:hypothetical protein
VAEQGHCCGCLECDDRGNPIGAWRPLSPTCPECHGVLVQLQDGRFTRFRCHTGHTYSLSYLLADVTQSLEHFLWSTVRTMEESILLLRHLAQYARDQQATQMAEVAERQVRDAERSTQRIRDLVRRQETLSKDWLRHDPGSSVGTPTGQGTRLGGSRQWFLNLPKSIVRHPTAPAAQIETDARQALMVWIPRLWYPLALHAPLAENCTA